MANRPKCAAMPGTKRCARQKAISSSYDPYARGMPSDAAAERALARSRDAMATTRESAVD